MAEPKEMIRYTMDSRQCDLCGKPEGMESVKFDELTVWGQNPHAYGHIKHCPNKACKEKATKAVQDEYMLEEKKKFPIIYLKPDPHKFKDRGWIIPNSSGGTHDNCIPLYLSIVKGQLLCKIEILPFGMKRSVPVSVLYQLNHHHKDVKKCLFDTSLFEPFIWRYQFPRSLVKEFEVLIEKDTRDMMSL